MAEDLMIGFKFRDNEDFAKDDAVKEVSDYLFAELTGGSAEMHLGAKAQSEPRMEKMVEDSGKLGEPDGFELTESFDFIF